MIRVLLVDDQSIIREGLSSLLKTQPDLEIDGEAENGQVAVERSLILQPNVVFMDIRMHIMDGVAAIKRWQLLLWNNTLQMLNQF